MSSRARRSRGGAIGDRVRRYRRERGWTQGQLAQRASLTRGTVSAIERGLERPLEKTSKALAEALGVSFERLIGLEGQATLFPLPDERRMAMIRRLVELDDDALEEVWPALRRTLDRAAEGAAEHD